MSVIIGWSILGLIALAVLVGLIVWFFREPSEAGEFTAVVFGFFALAGVIVFAVSAASGVFTW